MHGLQLTDLFFESRTHNTVTRSSLLGLVRGSAVAGAPSSASSSSASSKMCECAFAALSKCPGEDSRCRTHPSSKNELRWNTETYANQIYRISS